MNGDAGGLVDHEHVVAFVDYADWFGGYGGLVAVHGVRDEVAVLDDVGGRRDGFAIDLDGACEHAVALERLVWANGLMCGKGTVARGHRGISGRKELNQEQRQDCIQYTYIV